MRQFATDYLMQNYMPIPEAGCWIWMGGWGGRGYGKVNKNGKTVCMPHRLFYAMHVGEIPDDLLVLHKCDTPVCCNPDHLFLGTHQDNADDRVRKGRGMIKGSKKRAHMG